MSNRLAETPCVLVTSQFGYSANMERILRSQAFADPSRAALMHGLALMPVCMLPAMRGDAGALFTVSALALSAGYVAAAARFAWRTERASARFLLHASLVHLPLLLLAVVCDPRTGALARLGWS